ncbi:unnamed protein product [Rotaria sp. Silwood1]|nr:unnamed protein product [Rotaria sp. Silwood1]
METNVSIQHDLTSEGLSNKNKSYATDMETSSDPTYLLPDYSKLSDSQFTQTLLTSTSTIINQDKLIEVLNQKDIFIFIRTLTQLLNRLNYSKLQHEQWSYYYNLGMTEGIWNGRVSKKMADANSMCYTYGRSKHLIKQRLDKHKLQYEKAQQALDEHMKNTPSNIDMDNIINMIHNLIEKDQYQLRLELERRKTMLRLDAEEHRLIETFYELKPRQTEIKSAKIIWKAIHEQQNIIDEIAIFKKWLEVHTQASSYTLQDVQLPKINHIFISLSFQRPTSSAEHVAEQTIANAEQIVQYYNKIINNEKNKLQCTRSHHKNIQQLDQIIKIISQREHIKNIYLHLSPMAYQANDTTETTGISSVSSDDELERDYFSWLPEVECKDNSINENDWSSSDDSDNDSDDKEITYHHKETSSDKNIKWSDGPYLTHDGRLQSMTRFERRQACYYQEKIQQIRQQLKDEHLILRPIYKHIGYHAESIDTFYNKVNQFLNRTSSYSLVFKLSHSYPTASQNHLAKIVARVETTLNNLFESKSITEAQYMAMKINRSTVRMNYLYFVPDTHKEGIPVQPIMVCNAGPTMGISRYLGRLLGLFFNDATHCKKLHKAYNELLFNSVAEIPEFPDIAWNWVLN